MEIKEIEKKNLPDIVKTWALKGNKNGKRIFKIRTTSKILLIEKTCLKLGKPMTGNRKKLK